MNTKDKLATIKALWEQYNAAYLEVLGKVNEYRKKLLAAMEEIKSKARHEVLFGVIDADLQIMVQDFNNTYGARVQLSEVQKAAEIWVLNQSWKKGDDDA